MATKKSKAVEKTKKSKKTSASLSKKSNPKTKAKGKKLKDVESADDAGIVVIDEDLEVDKNAELEARQAYLEEARSQEAFD
jgi:Tfp pilus assembly major pilin PilA